MNFHKDFFLQSAGRANVAAEVSTNSGSKLWCDFSSQTSCFAENLTRTKITIRKIIGSFKINFKRNIVDARQGEIY